MSEKISLLEFYKKLESHDWFYSYSDDHSAWRCGDAAESKLQLLAKQSPEHQALFNGFKKHMFSGPSWGTEKAPKPEQPGE